MLDITEESLSILNTRLSTITDPGPLHQPIRGSWHEVRFRNSRHSSEMLVRFPTAPALVECGGRFAGPCWQPRS
jgi:hypothetical protein